MVSETEDGTANDVKVCHQSKVATVVAAAAVAAVVVVNDDCAPNANLLDVSNDRVGGAGSG